MTRIHISSTTIGSTRSLQATLHTCVYHECNAPRSVSHSISAACISLIFSSSCRVKCAPCCLASFPSPSPSPLPSPSGRPLASASAAAHDAACAVGPSIRAVSPDKSATCASSASAASSIRISRSAPASSSASSAARSLSSIALKKADVCETPRAGDVATCTSPSSSLPLPSFSAAHAAASAGAAVSTVGISDGTCSSTTGISVDSEGADRRRTTGGAAGAGGKKDMETAALIVPSSGSSLSHGCSSACETDGLLDGSTESNFRTSRFASMPLSTGSGCTGRPLEMMLTSAAMSCASKGNVDASIAKRITPQLHMSDFPPSYSPSFISSGAA
mmetsp:Transcript_53453/g.122839  ORF Transcript_53453/g.122839 Transcript_53453/m.122839 type:complete len:332 (-) Transcript_53453:833-1828(-)